MGGPVVSPSITLFRLRAGLAVSSRGVAILSLTHLHTGPPINCPKWVCCLLPCINHVESMKQFRLVLADDAEVRRDGVWIRYDAASLVVGDIIRVVEGDVIPADCIVVSLGMDHVDLEGGGGNEDTITVDSRLVTGEERPRQIPQHQTSEVEQSTLFYGSRVLDGAAICVVTATGDRVVLSKLIKEGRFPPTSDLTEEVTEIGRLELEMHNEEIGIEMS